MYPVEMVRYLLGLIIRSGELRTELSLPQFRRYVVTSAGTNLDISNATLIQAVYRDSLISLSRDSQVLTRFAAVNVHPDFRRVRHHSGNGRVR